MEENVNLYMYSKSPISTYDILGLKISICKQAVEDFEKTYKIKTSQRTENSRTILFGIKSAKSNTSITDEIIEKMIKSQEIYEIKGGNSRLALQNLANHIDSRQTTVSLADMYKIPFPSEDNNYKESNIKLYYKELGNKRRRDHRIETFKKWNEQKQDKITYACLNAVLMIMRTASHENDKLKNRKYEEVHIPGDWLYIRNTTFVKTKNPSVIQGENLIYMGNRQYWGAPTGKKNTYGMV